MKDVMTDIEIKVNGRPNDDEFSLRPSVFTILLPYQLEVQDE